ncbi:hypothetical protein EYF80_021640 [Liparis tanakae]|uniref:Uncharacterized protein n=1 Tax=Liparis tanakae TaxID=230148 RepID=A0A4Z2HR13_9TELE|nr:hypothetical protein EYF80_021640 [Liparis tanakae]
MSTFSSSSQRIDSWEDRFNTDVTKDLLLHLHQLRDGFMESEELRGNLLHLQRTRFALPSVWRPPKENELKHSSFRSSLCGELPTAHWSSSSSSWSTCPAPWQRADAPSGSTASSFALKS